jgi:hypothetical protein
MAAVGGSIKVGGLRDRYHLMSMAAGFLRVSGPVLASLTLIPNPPVETLGGVILSALKVGRFYIL